METTKSGRMIKSMNNKLKNEMSDDVEDQEDENFGEGRRRCWEREDLIVVGLYDRVARCTNDMSNCKAYHRRHKVCEIHSKALIVITGGGFVSNAAEFDDAKRSCRRRLAGHNERAQKIPDYITNGKKRPNQLVIK